ncbi:unnamed protein product [Arabis nemorensis]|uniref:Neprosin PEP catalytic domain-containing protein n=1 Tax=Arabis nemorensis TaxID=586526 RepID=A0A565CEE2_9BRAS|nr:unnamed protein product [Arabis nemorensis]
MQRETMSNRTFGHLWENGVGCPIGTVPILRVTKNDLLRLKSFGGNNYNPRGSWNNTYQAMSSGDGHHFAVTRTKGKAKSYNGASMNVGIKFPQVEPNQYSAARLCIKFGNELIQAGWTARGNACYNSACSAGIINVRHDIPVGMPLDQERKKRVDIDIAVIKDRANGAWWLLFNTTCCTREEIGFWPAKRFKESFGTFVEWGGEVFSISPPSPPMGNGKFPSGDPHVDAYIRRLSIVDGNYKMDDVVENTENYSDNTRGYKVRDATETWWTETGHLVIYGGPGKI